MRRCTALLVLVFLSALPAPARAQSGEEGRGLWLSGGAGFGTYDCPACDARIGGVGGGAAFGATLRPDFLLGVAGTGWIGDSEGNTEALLALTPMARVYPGGGRLSITGGLGLGMAMATRDHREAGVGGLIGLAYDVRGSATESLTLYLQGVGVATEPRANLLMLGVGLTRR